MILPLIATPTVSVDVKEQNEMSLSHAFSPPVVRVPQDSTATVLRVTFHDEDGAIVDLSSATGAKLFHASTIDGTAVTTDGAAVFTTDGSDGQVQYQLTSAEVGIVRDLRCEFEIQGYNGGNLISEEIILRVVERAKAG